MFGDDRKRYGLRSNTNTRTQYEPARLQKDPPRTSNTPGSLAAQYVGPGNSKPYATPANPIRYAGSRHSSPYVAAVNPAPYTSGGYPSSYASPMNQAPYTSPEYSRPPQNPTPTKPTPYADSGYPRQPSGPVPPPQYARPRDLAQNESSRKTADQLLADLIGQFSETRIDQRPSIQDYPAAPISTPPCEDAINQVVQEVLTRDLKTLGNEKLLPTNPVFDLARQFARNWNISDEAVNSHIRLACGYFKFPVILLLNPAPTHEFMPFDKMVDECKTLRWIEDLLYGIGLGLGDVIILDACTLLGSDRIKQLGKEGKRKKEQAMAEAYTVTQEMLRLIKPNIILSCQCSTSFSDWSAGGHVIARQLCSSIRSAKNREVKKVYLNERAINVIQAYHPSGFLNNKGDRKAHHDTFGNLLQGVFQTVYSPCGNWKSQHLIAALALSNTTKSIGASANNSMGKETKGLYKV